jgi:hypothetical protein
MRSDPGLIPTLRVIKPAKEGVERVAVSRKGVEQRRT